MLSRGVVSLFSLGDFIAWEGEERGSVGDFMPSVVWIGDRSVVWWWSLYHSLM